MESAAETMFAFLTKPICIIGYILFMMLSYFYLDKPVAIYFHQLNLTVTLPILSYITQLGLGAIYIILFFCMGFFFRYIHINYIWEARSWLLLVCVVIPGIICNILKISLGRARPDLLFDQHIYGFYGLHFHAPFLSCPSGHTTEIMGVVFGLSIIFLRGGYLLILIGLLIASLRVILFRHYLSDVLIATYLTLIEIGIVLYICRRKHWLAPAWQRKD